MKRLLITGAAGQLGRMARARLAHLADMIRLSDIAPMDPAGPHEEVVPCDLADARAVMALVEGCGGIVHLGGVSVERSFDQILPANIIGVHNLYEAARAHGMPRILMASSNHAIGFHRQDRTLDAAAAMRPDGWYGISKCFAENVASMYHDKFGQQSALVRIGSCLPAPAERRHLSTWLSHDDFVSLTERVFKAPRLGCPVIYGASANDASWWDNGAAAYLGWRPKDNAAAWRDALEAAVPDPDPAAPEAVYQGGVFTANPILKD
jgi:uronate dehydrogenase